MIAIGLVCSPLEFGIGLRDRKEKFTVNEIGKPKTILFTTLKEFTRMRQRSIPKRVLIFDAPERLEMVQGLTVFKQKTANTLLPMVFAHETKSPDLYLKDRNYVLEIIEKNKDDRTSFIHTYNTNLYNISAVPTREIIRSLYLSYLTGSIDRRTLDRELQPHYPKRGKSLLAMNGLMELLDTDLFKRMQTAMQKARGKPNKELEAIAAKYEVAPFDLRYFLSTLK